MFGSSIRLLLLIVLYVSLAHGRHCQTDRTCFEATKFTLQNKISGDIMIAGPAGQDYGKTITFHNRIDDVDMIEWTETERGQLVHFSPCDDVGPATFNNGNTFEICVWIWNGDCRKERLVQDSYRQMIMVSKVERHHLRLVAEVIQQEDGYYGDGISVKIREMGNPNDSNPDNFYKLRLREESLRRRDEFESQL